MIATNNLITLHVVWPPILCDVSILSAHTDALCVMRNGGAIERVRGLTTCVMCYVGAYLTCQRADCMPYALCGGY